MSKQIITNKTLFNDVLFNSISKTERERVASVAVRYFIGCEFWEMKLGQFIKLVNGDFDAVKNDTIENGGLTIFGKLFIQSATEFIEKWANNYAKLTPTQTALEQQASAVCLKSTFAESLLIFARTYFGLKSFAEAEEIGIADLLLAKKDTYNEAVFRRKLNELETNKLKSHRK